MKRTLTLLLAFLIAVIVLPVQASNQTLHLIKSAPQGLTNNPELTWNLGDPSTDDLSWMLVIKDSGHTVCGVVSGTGTIANYTLPIPTELDDPDGNGVAWSWEITVAIGDFSFTNIGNVILDVVAPNIKDFDIYMPGSGSVADIILVPTEPLSSATMGLNRDTNQVHDTKHLDGAGNYEFDYELCDLAGNRSKITIKGWWPGTSVTVTGDVGAHTRSLKSEMKPYPTAVLIPAAVDGNRWQWHEWVVQVPGKRGPMLDILPFKTCARFYVRNDGAVGYAIAYGEAGNIDDFYTWNWKLNISGSKDFSSSANCQISGEISSVCFFSNYVQEPTTRSLGWVASGVKKTVRYTWTRNFAVGYRVVHQYDDKYVITCGP